MDDLNRHEEEVEEIIEEEELVITDKIVGVLTEPGKLFSSLSKVPVKAIDWVLPLLFVIITAIISNYTIMTNPELKLRVMEKQMEQIEKNFQEMVDKGQLTRDQADEQLDKIDEQMNQEGSGQIIIGAVGIVITTFIIFFIIAGIFYLLASFVLGGTGNYKASMLAYGLPQYIIAIQVIVIILSAVFMGELFKDTSIASFLGNTQEGIVGWLLHKLDPFSIWFYSVVGIAYAKMFKSENTTKYVVAILGMWIGFSLLLHLLAEVLPFLKWFGI